jgi:putative Holliday junction resolvase
MSKEYQKKGFCASILNMAKSGRFLGIDYGTKRIGVSVSDENGTLAFPKEILGNDSKIFDKLGGIIEKEKISEIVIGESVDSSGKSNKIAPKIEVFILELKEKFKLPVHKQKEFFTSIEARRYQTKPARADAGAAALILQRYLDRINNQT